MQANTLDIGTGIYTLNDAPLLLGIPKQRLSRWLSTYWNTRFITDSTYTQKDGGLRYFNFHTLIELKVVSIMREAGLSFLKIEEAHRLLSEQFNSPYPFAYKDLYLSKNWIYFLTEKGVVSADKKMQYGLEEFIKPYAQLIDFDERDKIASALYLNEEKDLVTRPDIQLGEPVFVGTRIKVHDIVAYVEAGESIENLTNDFGLSKANIEHALSLYSSAA